VADKLALKPGTRSIVCGRTGSGKSTFAVYLLRRSRQKWILINPKDDDKIRTLQPARVVGFDAEKIRAAWAAGYQFVSVVPELGDGFEAVDYLIQEFFESTANWGLYIDELYFAMKNGRCGKGLQAVLTRGRSDNITFFGATQRPAFVCGFCFSESETVYMLQLSMESDRKRVYSFVGNKRALTNPDDYCIHAFSATGAYKFVKMRA
jgi:energy-coupling factor transporter ATP-binding protein EcfA2